MTVWSFGKPEPIPPSGEYRVQWDDGTAHGTILVDALTDFAALTEPQKIEYVEAKLKGSK